MVVNYKIASKNRLNKRKEIKNKSKNKEKNTQQNLKTCKNFIAPT